MRITQSELSRVITWLDEKYLMTDDRVSEVEYLAVLKTIEMLGFYWERKNGKHFIYK